MSRQVNELNWLITDFADRVPDVAHAIVVSSDGLPLASSAGFPADRADQLAAIASGLSSLTQGAARVFEGGAVAQTVVEMERGLMLIMAISDGSCMAVLTAPGTELKLVGFQMAKLVENVAHVLTPQLRSQLREVIQN